MTTTADASLALVIGAGRRVLETIVPVLAHVPDRWTLAGIRARSRRTVDVHGTRYVVEPLDELTDDLCAVASLVIVAVSKEVVPAVLRRLRRHDVSRLHLLVDTPVLRFRDLGRLRLLEGFAGVSVAEDCAVLPWIDVVHAAADDGPLGRLHEVRFEHAAWHYHGLATAKALLRGGPIVRGRRRRLVRGAVEHHASTHDGDAPRKAAASVRIEPTARVELRLADGTRAVVVEPRDYAAGRIVVTGERASVTDRPRDGERHLRLESIIAGTRCTGFRIGDVTTSLDPEESELLDPATPGEPVTKRMPDMKKVGLLRILRSIHEGRGGYPLDDGLDDMAAAYLMEKVGLWVRTPFTSLASPVGRAVLRFSMGLLGGRGGTGH